VGSDPELFPSPENSEQPFQDKTAPEVRVIAAKLAKQSTQAHPFHDPGHVRTLVATRLVSFAFLNDPPTATVSVYIC